MRTRFLSYDINAPRSGASLQHRSAVLSRARCAWTSAGAITLLCRGLHTAQTTDERAARPTRKPRTGQDMSFRGSRAPHTSKRRATASPTPHTRASPSPPPPSSSSAKTVHAVVHNTNTHSFQAYLRSLSDPFTAPDEWTTCAHAALTSSDETYADPMREWHVVPGETPSMPMNKARQARQASSSSRHPQETEANDRTRWDRYTRDEEEASYDVRQSRQPSSAEASLAVQDTARVRALRQDQQVELHHREAVKLVQELRQALDVLRDAEKAFFDFTTTTAPNKNNNDNNNNKNNRTSSSSTPEAKAPSSDASQTASEGEDTRRYRVDAFLYERVGQLQRTLRTLHTRHFHAAVAVAAPDHHGRSHARASASATFSSSSSSLGPAGPRLLVETLETLLRTLTYLSHLSQHATAMTPAVLPTCLTATKHDKKKEKARTPRSARYVYLPGLLPPHFVESSIRQTGCLYAVRELARVLVALDNDTWSACMTHVLQHGTPAVSSTSSSSVAPPWLLLRSHDVLTMLDAALTLPSDDALHVQALVPSTHPTTTKTSSSSSASSSHAMVLWQPVTVPLEEWCVHRWLYFQTVALYTMHEGRGTTPPAHDDLSTKDNGNRTLDDSVRRLLPTWLRAQVLTTRQWIAVIRTAMSAVEDPSNLMLRATSTFVLAGSARGTQHGGAPRPDRHTLRVPYGVGKEFTMLFLRYLTERAELAASSSSSSSSLSEKDPETLCLDDLHVRDVATLCSAVLFYDVLTTEALHVLIQAAPRCVAEVHALRGAEVSDMLLAYASLKFHGRIAPTSDVPSAESVNFYIALGTRAGELGDTLRVEDTTRVLRALEMTGIEHETLRKSFESSLRLRSVTRRQHLV